MTGGCEWRHALEARTEDFGDLRKVSELSFSVRRRRLIFRARRGLEAGVERGGDRWKSKHRKMVSLSLCQKTFKLKGNKKIRTWTKKS